MHKSKKIISILAAAMLATSTLAISACGSKGGYQGEKLTAGYESAAAVTSNGGFVVEKGNYVYFINGSEVSTANNTYGKPVKGSLMRISKDELAEGKYSQAQIVVPSLFVAGDYESGVYIYGDYAYYATPTNAKNNDGQIENSYLDFKRAKLDGTKAPMDGKKGNLFRLSSNTSKYRFVEVDGTVYCLFEEDSKLKSYNVTTGTTTVLVSGASSFIYDKKDLTNPNVYYTMGVTYDVEKENSSTAKYNQIYCVNAAATATTDAATASYTVYEGETKLVSYDFDETAMKADAKEKEYDLADYSTYPYVNLGKLVLDGAGSTEPYSKDTRFNVDAGYNAEGVYVTEASKIAGYSYTLQQQGNGGIYFTRTDLDYTDGTDPKAAYLYYMPSANAEGNTITRNATLATVAQESTNASTSAIFTIENDKHVYYYATGTTLKKAVAGVDGVPTEITLTKKLPSEPTLWKIEQADGAAEAYLYYYAAGTNGKSLERIRCNGVESDYQSFDKEKDEFKPLKVAFIDFYDSWYKPEFVTAGNQQFVLFANAQSYGTAGSYNYIYAAKLGTTAEMLERNEQYEAVQDYIDEYSENTQVQDVMRYYFRTGKTGAYEAVKDLYKSEQQTYVDEFVAKFTSGEFAYEGNLISLLGRMTEEDTEAIDEAWANSLLQEEEEEDEGGLPTWAIVLIVVGSVVVVAAAALIPTLIVCNKKKAKKRREQEIVSAYKHKKIDTTDDKTIDVYADETPVEEEPVVEEEKTSDEE